MSEADKAFYDVLTYGYGIILNGKHVPLEKGLKMPEIDDGGPAFPGGVRDTDGNWISLSGDPGMSLRDWFAGQALSNMAGSSADQVAKLAYNIADAMLAARKGGNNG